MSSKPETRCLPALLFLLFITAITAAFIIFYCELFNFFGLCAKVIFLLKPFTAFFITPLFFLMSAYLCRKYAPTVAGGSLGNIEKSLAELQKNPDSFEKIRKFLGFKTVFVNAASSLLSTLGGGALGREGPAVQMSAGIFGASADKLKSFFPQVKLESWIYAGSGAGIAFAFNAPCAGFIYVVEKLFNNKSKIIQANLLWSAAAICVATLALIDLETLFPMQDRNLQLYLNYKIGILGTICTSIICGFCAYFLREIIHYLHEKISKIKSNKWFLIPIIAGFTVSTISYYSGTFSFSGGIYTTKEVLTNSETILSYKEFFGRFANTIATAIAGCAGGLVAPSIALGAGIGSITSEFFSDINNKILILSGITAFLSAILKQPVTAVIIVLEITRQSILGFPLFFLAAITSYVVIYFLNKRKDFFG